MPNSTGAYLNMQASSSVIQAIYWLAVRGERTYIDAYFALKKEVVIVRQLDTETATQGKFSYHFVSDLSLSQLRNWIDLDNKG